MLNGLSGADAVVSRHGPLSVAGGRIVDRFRTPYVLRGVSLFWSQWMAQYYNADVIRWLKRDWKVNVVRAAMAVHRGGYLEFPEEQFARISAVVDAAIAADLYVIIDWHAHDREDDEACAFFARLTAKYPGVRNLICELWNEPDSRYDWSRDIKPYHDRVIAAIRRNCPDTLIIAGTENFSQRVDRAALDPLADTNVAYAVHFYAASHGPRLRHRILEAMRAELPLLASEYGTCEADGDGRFAPEETAAWWRFLEACGIGYLNWAVSDKDEAASALVPGAASLGGWREEELSPSGRLVRAHLRTFGGALDA